VSDNSNNNTLHPWRLCPYGEHWVKEHELHIPPNHKNPEGSLTTRKGHCAKNPSKKDSLYLDEIHEIADKYFKNLVDTPSSNSLGFKNGNAYDSLIGGWSKYWNDVFKPKISLDPDIVKALIASESSFITKPHPQKTKVAGKARGLIQITDQARRILGDPHGELRDHLVHINQDDLIDPNASICAGIRWLFQKQKLASNRLEHEASWEESVSEYKGYLKDIISGKNPNPKGMRVFSDNLKKLKAKTELK
jgi:hypothetical protein